METPKHLPTAIISGRHALNGARRAPAAHELPPLYRMFLHERRANRRSPMTIQWYQEAFENFCSFAVQQGMDPGSAALLGDRAVIKPVILDWLASLEQRGNSPHTQNSRFRALRAFFNWLVDVEEVIEKSPLHKMPAPSLPWLIPETYTEGDLLKMLRLCPPNTLWGARDAVILLLAITGGLRRQEIALLDRDQTDLSRGVVKVKGKGRKERLAPLSDAAVYAILRYDRFRDLRHPALLQSIEPDGVRHMTPHAVYKAFHNLAVRVGIPGRKLGVHRGRHTFSIETLKKSGDIKLLQELLGHGRITTTEIYTRALGSEWATAKYREIDPFSSWRL